MLSSMMLYCCLYESMRPSMSMLDTCHISFWNLNIENPIIFQALGPGFSQFAEPVFQRCINIIQTQQMTKVGNLTFAIISDSNHTSCLLGLSDIEYLK